MRRFQNNQMAIMQMAAMMQGGAMGAAPHLAGLPGMPSAMPGMQPMGLPPGGALGMPLGVSDTGVTVVDNITRETLLLDIVTGAILSDPVVLYGLGVVVTNFRGSFSQDQLGTAVKVPYWNILPEFQDLNSDGDKVNYYQLRSLAEENTIKHAGIGLQVTDWAQLFTRDGGRSQEEFANQARARWASKADGALLQEAMTKAVAADDTVFEENTQARRYLDVYNAGTPRYFGRELYIDGIGARGAIGVNEKPALIVMHTDTLTRSMKVNNAIGDPNLIAGANQSSDDRMQVLMAGPTELTMVPYNVPIMATDSALFKPAAGKYRTLALYKNALAWWQNPGMTIERARDIDTPSDKLALHMWYVAHCYQRRDMSPRAGVFCWQHN
jgi:hypothetical protein